jgi:hypothetical protein
MMTMFGGSGGGDAGAPVVLRKPQQLVSESDSGQSAAGHSGNDGDEDEEEAEN